MTARWITALLCVLYMSASTVFSAIHHHEGASLQGDPQCAACAWHHDGTVDAPEITPLLAPPDKIVFRDESPVVVSAQFSLRVHPSRGPPVLPL